MMKKKSNVRNIRKRVGDSEDEDAGNMIPFLEEDYHAQVKKVMEERATKKKGKEKKIDKSKEGSGQLLSFGGDEEEGTDVFQVKKSSMSRRMKKEKTKKKREPEEEIKISGTDEAALNEMTSDKSDKTEEEESIVLIGMDAEAAVVAEEDQHEINDGFRRLASGLIPDASMIYAARKKRQMAREFGSDYIPVDDTRRYGSSDKSRLVRDDDNDRSGSDSDDGRMSLVLKQTTKRERVQEAMEPDTSSNEGSDLDHDEELERWEQEQIKKGISVQQVQGINEENSNYTTYPQDETSTTSGQVWYGAPYNSESTKVAPDSCNLPIQFTDVTLEEITKKLKDRLEPLEEVHRSHRNELEQLEDRMKTSALSRVELKDTSGGVTVQYNFYQEMRAYIKDLMDCLNEKVPTINCLEITMLSLLKNRANFLIQRRQGDIKDQSDEFISQKAATGANLTMKHSKANREEKQKNRRIAEREGRRARRRRLREGSVQSSSHFEGISSDDEQAESQQAQFKTERDKILKEADILFQDVVDDFHSLPVIQSKFEQWKRQHSQSYEEAYIGLCLSKLYNPFVRLQLLDWDPLETECKVFESMDWFDTFIFYGYEESTELDRDDPDIKLVPNLVEKVLLPRLTVLVATVWDPMSRTQTYRLVDTIRCLANDYPTVSSFNKNTQMLLEAIVKRMKKTLDDDVYMPLFPKTMLEQKGAMDFMQRQFWSSVKLLGNIVHWYGLVDQNVLMEIALDGLLNRYILLALHNSEVDHDSLVKCQKISEVFPREWFHHLEGDCTLKQLEPLCKYLLNSVDTMHTKFFGGTEGVKKAARTHIKVTTKILVSLHAMDHALSVTSDYSLKDIKKMLNH